MAVEISARFLAQTRTTLAAAPLRLFIDGKWVDAFSGKTFEVRDPATGLVIAHAAAGEAGDIDAAVAAARRAFDVGPWGSMLPPARRALMLRLADALEASAEELALLDCLDNGMPVNIAHFFAVNVAAEAIRYNAGWIGKINGETPVVSMPNQHVYTLREPVGVVGAILPWNGPLGMIATRVATVLAAGCTIVVKPAELTPLSAIRFAKLAQEVGIPDGVINVVTGFGHTAGQALAEHRGVDKITFTGSTSTGKSIVRAAAGNLKRVSLELGGKSPVIIMPDADIEAAIVGASNGIFWNSGQICVAGSRLYAHEAVFDQVVEGIARRADSLAVGSGLDPANDIGPLISEAQRERVKAYIGSGVADGATIVAGGNVIARDGYFMQPTILTNTRPDMRVVREEIFGPVLCAMRMSNADLDALVSAANDTEYGLSAYVWTRDLSIAHTLARRIKSGSVRINGGVDLDPALPFGGLKQSGWGRENGREGIELYYETKSVSIKL